MFNTYQELVDRIEELIQDKKKLQKRITELEELYNKIPDYVIRNLYDRGILTLQEKMFWNMLEYKKLKKKIEKKVKNNEQIYK